VFDRFYRADRSRQRPGGSGLGLAIVAAIAETHGGEASVISAPGRGTTFTLRLPAA
jgi:signal transduction histidine kinase